MRGPLALLVLMVIVLPVAAPAAATDYTVTDKYEATQTITKYDTDGYFFKIDSFQIYITLHLVTYPVYFYCISCRDTFIMFIYNNITVS